MLSLLGIIAGLVLLIAGGTLLVSGASRVATGPGVSPMVIGLTIVGFGTSMPELVTSAVAAYRGESDLAVGNVVGSNLFNSLFVLPVSGSIAPVPIPALGLLDLAVSWGLTAMLIPICFLGEARIGRTTGVVLLIGYAGYTGLRVTQG